MPVTTDDKQQSKSTTLPVSQLTIKKTLSLTSSQCKRPLTDKLSSGNFSWVFKLKVPRHSQDRESDVLFKSYGQSNAREIGNFQQGHRKQRKIQESVGATKSGSYKRQIMNRQQLHATLESEREKLETEEDKLGNCHNDPDHMVDTIWYKDLWRALKKQAKKIANSNADADSSSDESVSNKTRVTKQPSGSTRNKHGKILVSDKNFIFPSSEGLKIESWEKVSYRKMIHVPPIDVFQPKQNSTTHFKLPVFRITTSEKTGEKPEEGREVTRLRPEQILSLLSNNWINVLPEEVRRNFISRLKSIHSEDSVAHFKLLVDIITTSEKTGEKPVENYRDYRMQDRFADIAQKQIKWKGDVINLDGIKNLKLKAVEKLLANNRDYRMQDRFADIAQKQTKLKRDVTNLNNWYYAMQCMKYTDFAQNENNLKFVITHLNNIDCDMKDSCADVTQKLTKLKRDVTNLINVQPEEVRRNFFNRSKSKHSKVKLLPDITTSSEKKGEKLVENSKTEERSNTQVNEKENKDVEKQEVAENLPKHGDNVVSSQNLDRPTTQDQRQDEIPYLLTNSKTEERSNTQVNEKENKDVEKQEVAENLPKHGENVVSSQNLDRPTTQEQRQDENSKTEERSNTQVNEKENKDVEKQEVAENLPKHGENVVSSQNLDRPTTQEQRQDENSKTEERSNTQVNEKENKDVEKQEVAENLPKHGDNVVSSQNLDRPTTQDQRQDENSKTEERSNTQVNEKENKDVEKQEVAENLPKHGENVVSSQNLDRPTTQEQRQDENSKTEERSNTQVNEIENKDVEKQEVAENLPKHGDNVVSSQNLDRPTTQDQRQDENSKTEERSNTQVNEKENKDVEKQEVAENLPKHGENVVSSQNLDRPTTQEQRQDENSKKEERSNTQVNEKEHKDEEKQEVAENLPKHGDNVVSSQNLDRPTTQDQRQDERRESTEASEGSTNRPIHPVDRHTTYNSEEDNRIVMRDSMIQIPSSEGNTDISSDESWSTVESALIRLYRNVIRNETSRMKSSLGMVRFEAEHLFGLERSRIFFDLLDEELFQFESAGAISEFVANMAESTVRQHVISFFEHANNTMSRLMTLLLRCTDSKILQQMPIQNFTSLMKSVIKSSLKAQTKGREKVSLEGNIYTMVDQKDFERALGEEIPEDVLNRLRSEDEMVVQSFVDTRQERHQPSDRKEDRPIQCIYFPSDCRLYIYVPTLNGSYWHVSDMRRAKRIRRHSR